MHRERFFCQHIAARWTYNSPLSTPLSDVQPFLLFLHCSVSGRLYRAGCIAHYLPTFSCCISPPKSPAVPSIVQHDPFRYSYVGLYPVVLGHGHQLDASHSLYIVSPGSLTCKMLSALPRSCFPVAKLMLAVATQAYSGPGWIPSPPLDKSHPTSISLRVQTTSRRISTKLPQSKGRALPLPYPWTRAGGPAPLSLLRLLGA